MRQNSCCIFLYEAENGVWVISGNMMQRILGGDHTWVFIHFVYLADDEKLAAKILCNRIARSLISYEAVEGYYVSWPFVVRH